MVLVCVIAFSHADRLASPGVAGTWGARFGALNRDQQRAILGLQEGSPFQRIGAQVGDRVKFDHRGDPRRAIGTDEESGVTWYRAHGGDATHVVVRPMVDAEVVADPVSAMLIATLRLALVITLVVISIVIAWRRPSDGALRLLVGTSLFNAHGFGLLHAAGFPAGLGRRTGQSRRVRPGVASY